MARQLNLLIEDHDEFREMVLMVSRFNHAAVCRVVLLHLGHYVFHDLFLLSLAGFGALLGVNWLGTLI